MLSGQSVYVNELEYVLERRLNGHQFRVWLTKRYSDAKPFVLKITDKPELVRAEVSAYKMLHDSGYPNRYLVELVDHDPITIVLEYLDGWQTLGEYARTKHNPSEVVRVVEKVGKRVRTLHEHQITHNDIRPANILLKIGKQMKVKLIDFGSSQYRGSRVKDLASVRRVISKLEDCIDVE